MRCSAAAALRAGESYIKPERVRKNQRERARESFFVFVLGCKILVEFDKF